MAFGNQPRRGRTAKPIVIDNRVYPSTAEVAKLLKVPAKRFRELKAMVDEVLKSEQ